MTRSVSTVLVAGGAASSEATSSTWALRLPRGAHLFSRVSLTPVMFNLTGVSLWMTALLCNLTAVILRMT
jgi:hypothetical protein